MNEDEKRERLLQGLRQFLHGEAFPEEYYWHHDEDFAAFMDAVLEPIDVDE